MIDNIRDLKQEAMMKCKDLDLQYQVGMHGSFHAELAIIAEAPGQRELSMKMPLVGGAGGVLWNALRRYKINRNQCYVTNLVKRQLLHGESKSKISAHELQHWSSLLRWELCQLPNVRYLLVLGGPALEALCDVSPITQWRGSVLPTTLKHVETRAQGMPVVTSKEVVSVVSYNPAAVLRVPRDEVVFRMDMHKLHRVMTGTYKEHAVNAHYNPSPTEAIQWMDKMQDEKLPISFDIETISGETACVGFANNATAGYCINYRTLDANRWSTADERRVRMRMQHLFADTNMSFVAQNGGFDCSWLWFKDRMHVHKVWFDTMLAHHTLYSQLPHNLGFLTAQYTDHPYYKDEGKDWREGGNIDQFWEYNCKDVCITRMAQQKMHEELRKFGQDEFFFNHVMRLQPNLVRMTQGGVLVDKVLKGEIADELAIEVQKLRDKFNEYVREATFEPDADINPNSPKQLSELFFKKLRLVGRGTSTNAMNRQRMRDHPSTPSVARDMLKSLDEYARENKFLSTYANADIDDDGRIRCEYKQMGVREAPGRLSSAQTSWGTGMNMQNQPERAYPMYVADPGWCMVYFDLAQAEARVVAWLAQIESWIEQFERARLDGSYDCHRALAAEMFEIAYDDVPTADRILNPETGLLEVTLRFVSKRCRHGLNYRMAADRLAETTGLTLNKAREAYSLYHRTTPELRQWWSALEGEVRADHKLVSPKGRVLRIMERLTEESMESIVAFKPQSTVGDHVSEVIYRSHDDPAWPTDSRVILNIHDALIALSRVEQAADTAHVMKQYAEAPIMIEGSPLIIPADFKVSLPDEHGVHRWSTLKGCGIDNMQQLLKEAA